MNWGREILVTGICLMILSPVIVILWYLFVELKWVVDTIVRPFFGMFS